MNEFDHEADPAWWEDVVARDSDQDEPPFDDGVPSLISEVDDALIDLRRMGVPDNFLRAMREAGKLPRAAKMISGRYLFEPRQALDVIEAYWQSLRVDRR